jgi:SAM-dependent methyltransferase
MRSKVEALFPDPANRQRRFDVLELGVGTGLLSGRLMGLFPDLRLSACDISSAMLEVCARKYKTCMESGRLNLFEHDFNSPLDMLPANFDFAVSSLALQWSSSIAVVANSVKTRLKPGGIFLFSVPLNGSLAALRAFFESGRLRFPGLELPTIDALKKATDCFENVQIETRLFQDGPYTLLDALRRFRELGAVNSGPPMKTKGLLKLVRGNGDRCVTLSYVVAFCLCR